MDDKPANIDILFRNGLKDYEVLPPQEVWNSIRPAISKHQHPVVLMRAAAMVAIVLSLSFFAYRWGRQISSVSDESNALISTRTEMPENNLSDHGIPQLIQVSDGRIYLAEAVDLPADKPETASIPVNKETETSLINTVNDAAVVSGLKPKQRSDIIPRKSGSPAPLTIQPIAFNEVAADNETPKHWSIAALVSPTYYKNFLSGGNVLAEQMMADEQARLSYSGGVALSYNINKRISIQSGLYYSSFGQEITGISTYAGFRNYDYTKGTRNFEVMTSTGTVYTSNSDVFLTDPASPDRVITRYTRDVFDPNKAELNYIDNSLRQDFSYLELPVVLRYKIIDKGIDFNIIGGFSSNILVANSVYANVSSGKYLVGKTDGMNSLSFSSSLGMGMEYNFSKNISFNVEPTLRYYINPFTAIPGMRMHPYSFGIFSGLSYKF